MVGGGYDTGMTSQMKYSRFLKSYPLRNITNKFNYCSKEGKINPNDSHCSKIVIGLHLTFVKKGNVC